MTTLTRGQFLRGDWQGRSESGRLINGRTLKIGLECLTGQGVVCRFCAEVCAEEAIRFHPVPGAAARPRLDSSRCTGCGDCLEACPASAITIGRSGGAAR